LIDVAMLKHVGADNRHYVCFVIQRGERIR
jgi:hypothetical protein